MAEVENLLGLITDETTRAQLLAQMEQMFDSAEDEGKLIEQIGSPTKVAVALIRYADKKRAAAEEKAAPAAEAPAPVTELMEEAEANAAAPESDVMPEMAFEEAPAEPEAPAAEEAPAEPEAPAAAEVPAEPEAPAEVISFAEVSSVVMPEEAPVEDAGFVDAAPVAEEPEDLVAELFDGVVEASERGEMPAEAPAVGVDEALVQAVAAEAAQAFGEIPAEAPAQPLEEPEKELVEELFGEPEAAEEETGKKGKKAKKNKKQAEEIPEEEEVETVTVGWKAFLYFLIPGLVPGLPVFLVLFALSLVFLVIGVAAVACAVGVFASAFIGFTVVADMLLLLGAGASLFAVAMVLLWFAIWFLTQVCFGWVRLIRRGGVRFSRKEVQAA